MHQPATQPTTVKPSSKTAKVVKSKTARRQRRIPDTAIITVLVAENKKKKPGASSYAMFDFLMKMSGTNYGDMKKAFKETGIKHCASLGSEIRYCEKKKWVEVRT